MTRTEDKGLFGMFTCSWYICEAEVAGNLGFYFRYRSQMMGEEPNQLSREKKVKERNSMYNI